MSGFPSMGDMPISVQRRITKDFERIAKQDGSNFMISKNDLSVFISDELNKCVRNGDLSPAKADGLLQEYLNAYDRVDSNQNGLDIEEFTTIFGNRYMEKYSAHPGWTTAFGIAPHYLETQLTYGPAMSGPTVNPEEPLPQDREVEGPTDGSSSPPPLPEPSVEPQILEGEDTIDGEMSTPPPTAAPSVGPQIFEGENTTETQPKMNFNI